MVTRQARHHGCHNGSPAAAVKRLLSTWIDFNDNGVVNIVDAMHVAQYTVDPTCAGDVLFKPLWEEVFDPLTDPPT